VSVVPADRRIHRRGLDSFKVGRPKRPVRTAPAPRRCVTCRRDGSPHGAFFLRPAGHGWPPATNDDAEVHEDVDDCAGQEEARSGWILGVERPDASRPRPHQAQQTIGRDLTHGVLSEVRTMTCIVCRRPLRGRLTSTRLYCTTRCRRSAEGARLQAKRAAAPSTETRVVALPSFPSTCSEPFIYVPFDWSTVKPWLPSRSD
jgi:hypothetical protein